MEMGNIKKYTATLIYMYMYMIYSPAAIFDTEPTQKQYISDCFVDDIIINSHFFRQVLLY